MYPIKPPVKGGLAQSAPYYFPLLFCSFAETGLLYAD
jgi:hypothetical protein